MIPCPFCNFNVPAECVAVHPCFVGAMNTLQGAGIISDNCVHWPDVAEVDRERALKWLAVGKGALL